MTREQITKGMPLLLAAKTEFEAMAETARCAIHYCYDQEAKNRILSPKGYAGFQRMRHIWTQDVPDAPAMFCGDAVRDRDMARGTVMAIYLLTTVFPAKTFQIPVYVETQVLLEDLLSGGWYE